MSGLEIDETVTAAPRQLLEPDRNQIEQFVDALFRYRGDDGFISFRSFYYDNKPLPIEAVPVNSGFKYLCDVAEDHARRAANAIKPAVFCPPIAVFNNKEHAAEQDLLAGLALSVECDQHPIRARARLEQILGPATVVVRSGGEWQSPRLPQDKLHLHFRLTRAAQGKEDLAKLKRLRRLAVRLAAGDASNVPIVHPIRWPGSWHRKREPRLCEIVALEPDREIDLDTAIAALEAALPANDPKGNGFDAGQRNHGDDSDRERPDWAELTANIVAGKNLHESTMRLAASYIGSGMNPDHAVRQLQALMLASTVPHDERWQARFGDLERLVADAQAKFGESGQTIEAEQELEARDAGDDIGKPPPRRWLMANQFCRRFLSGLVAPGSTGKSALRMLQCLALAIGVPLTGQHIFRRCRVLMVSFEDDMEELQRRILAAMLEYGITRDQVKDWLFYACPKGIKLAEMKNGSRQIGALGEQLRAWIEKHHFDLVVLDPYVKVHALEENDNNAMDFVCDLPATLAIKYDIAIDAPHHTRKGLLTPGDADAGRGGSAVRDAGRLIYTLSTMSEEEAKQFDIDPEDCAAYIRLDKAKVNLTPPARTAEWFELVGVRLDNGNDEYPNGDEVQTVKPWKPPKLWEGLASATLNAALTDIDNGMPNGQRYTDAGGGKGARAAWPVVQKHCPNRSEGQCREIIRTWIKNGVLYAADYYDPIDRKNRSGLRLDTTKRPS
jgi:hypothetical protein